MKVTNLDAVPYIKMLVYGDSGSGKTTLVGSSMKCDHTFPLLVANARGQPVSLRPLSPRPLVIDIETVKDFNIIYDYFYFNQDMDNLKRKSATLYEVIAAYLDRVKTEKFRTLAIDSITQVQRLAMDIIMQTPDSKGRVVGPTMPENPADIPAQTQIQHWGRTLALMTNFTDRYFKLNVNVIMTALTRWHEIPAFGYTMFHPFLWGQSNMEIPSHAEIVGRLVPTATVPTRDERLVEAAAKQAKAKTPFNVLYTAGGRTFIAKWQGVPNAPKMIPAPTISKMVNVLAGQGG